MNPVIDPKKKLLKQIEEITACLQEHGLKPRLSDVGDQMLEFTVGTTKPLTLIIKSLYMRDGVSRVLVTTSTSRREPMKYIQICLEEGFKS